MANRSRQNQVRLFGALGLLVVGLLFCGTAAARGACVSAQIDQTFVLPDGSEHLAGQLSLCVEATHSPIASLHQMRVDGIPVGLLISRRDVSEARSDESPYMVFTRLDDGRLVLDGYTERGSAGTTVYALRAPLTRVRTFMLAEAETEPAPVLVAALLD